MLHYIYALFGAQSGGEEGNSLFSVQVMTLFYTLGLGGIITSVLWQLYYIVYEQIERIMITSVKVDNMDPVYKWLL